MEHTFPVELRPDPISLDFDRFFVFYICLLLQAFEDLGNYFFEQTSTTIPGYNSFYGDGVTRIRETLSALLSSPAIPPEAELYNEEPHRFISLHPRSKDHRLRFGWRGSPRPSSTGWQNSKSS
jgi:hypothetical protein